MGTSPEVASFTTATGITADVPMACPTDNFGLRLDDFYLTFATVAANKKYIKERSDLALYHNKGPRQNISMADYFKGEFIGTHILLGLLRGTLRSLRSQGQIREDNPQNLIRILETVKASLQSNSKTEDEFLRQQILEAVGIATYLSTSLENSLKKVNDDAVLAEKNRQISAFKAQFHLNEADPNAVLREEIKAFLVAEIDKEIDFLNVWAQLSRQGNEETTARRSGMLGEDRIKGGSAETTYTAQQLKDALISHVLDLRRGEYAKEPMSAGEIDDNARLVLTSGEEHIVLNGAVMPVYKKDGYYWIEGGGMPERDIQDRMERERQAQAGGTGEAGSLKGTVEEEDAAEEFLTQRIDIQKLNRDFVGIIAIYGYIPFKKLYVAAGADAWLLFQQSLPAVKKLFTDQEFKTYWPDLVRLGIASGTNAWFLFQYGLPAVKALIIDRATLNQIGDDLVRLGVAAGADAWDLFRYGLPVVKALIIDRATLNQIGDDLVRLGIASGTNAWRLFQHGLPAVKELFTDQEFKTYWEMVMPGLRADADLILRIRAQSQAMDRQISDAAVALILFKAKAENGLRNAEVNERFLEKQIKEISALEAASIGPAVGFKVHLYSRPNTQEPDKNEQALRYLAAPIYGLEWRREGALLKGVEALEHEILFPSTISERVKTDLFYYLCETNMFDRARYEIELQLAFAGNLTEEAKYIEFALLASRFYEKGYPRDVISLMGKQSSVLISGGGVVKPVNGQAPKTKERTDYLGLLLPYYDPADAGEIFHLDNQELIYGSTRLAQGVYQLIRNIKLLNAALIEYIKEDSDPSKNRGLAAIYRMFKGDIRDKAKEFGIPVAAFEAIWRGDYDRRKDTAAIEIWPQLYPHLNKLYQTKMDNPRLHPAFQQLLSDYAAMVEDCINKNGKPVAATKTKEALTAAQILKILQSKYGDRPGLAEYAQQLAKEGTATTGEEVLAAYADYTRRNPGAFARWGWTNKDNPAAQQPQAGGTGEAEPTGGKITRQATGVERLDKANLRIGELLKGRTDKLTVVDIGPGFNTADEPWITTARLRQTLAANGLDVRMIGVDNQMPEYAVWINNDSFDDFSVGFYALYDGDGNLYGVVNDKASKGLDDLTPQQIRRINAVRDELWQKGGGEGRLDMDMNYIFFHPVEHYAPEAGIEPVKGDLFGLRLAEQADLIRVSNVLMHYPPEQRRLALERLKVHLKENGYLFLSTNDNTVGGHEYVIYRKTGQSLEIVELGFTIDEHVQYDIIGTELWENGASIVLNTPFAAELKAVRARMQGQRFASYADKMAEGLRQLGYDAYINVSGDLAIRFGSGTKDPELNRIKPNNFDSRGSLGQDSKSDTFIVTEQKDTGKGGIDFSGNMPIAIQPMGGLRTIQPSSPLTFQREVNPELAKEWQEIERMLAANITPSPQRIKEYLQGCVAGGCADKEIDKVLGCIADIMRMEEERCTGSDESLKEILVMLEQKPSAEFAAALQKIDVLPGEPAVIK